MKVSDYQKLYDILESVDIDETDKAAYCICYVLGKKPNKVDNYSKARFNYNWVRTQYKLQFAQKPLLFGKKPNTDATKITYGQFAEIMHWTKGGIIEQMHMIHATMLNTPNHKLQADKSLKTNVRKVLPYVLEFMQSFDALLSRYKKLFTPDKVAGDDGKHDKPHPFVEQYGWIFSATRLADHNRIKLDEAYRLPIVQALNDLSFLKSLSQFEEQQAHGK